jgi:hypothetical protein
MPWTPKSRLRVDPKSPRAGGICDRCGERYLLDDLNWQFDWRGPRLMNLRLRVCYRCMDKPFEHNRPIITPPDPQPVLNPRPRLPNPEIPPEDGAVIIGLIPD